jgi:hypothetical protein
MAVAYRRLRILTPNLGAFILETVEMIHELDDTRPQEMSPLFYQHLLSTRIGGFTVLGDRKVCKVPA